MMKRLRQRSRRHSSRPLSPVNFIGRPCLPCKARKSASRRRADTSTRVRVVTLFSLHLSRSAEGRSRFVPFSPARSPLSLPDTFRGSAATRSTCALARVLPWTATPRGHLRNRGKRRSPTARHDSGATRSWKAGARPWRTAAASARERRGGSRSCRRGSFSWVPTAARQGSARRSRGRRSLRGRRIA